MADVIVRTLIPEVLDPDLIKLAVPIARSWEAAAVRVAASQVDSAVRLSTAADSPESILAAHFREIARARPDAAQRAGQRATAALRSPATQRRLAETTVPTRTADELLSLVDGQYAPLGIQRSTPATALNQRRSINVELRRVRCIDETNFLGSERGHDEISMSGLTIDESAKTGKIRPFKVGDFDDGTVKTFVPGRHLVTYPGGGTTFPKHYFTTLLLFEVDQGNLPETMEKILRKFADEVAAKVVGAAGTVLGGAAGALIGWLVGWLAGKLMNLLIAWWEDDPFNPVTLEIIVPSADAVMPLSSSEVHFGGPGDYRVEVWRTVSSNTLFDLSGRWTDGGTAAPVISVRGNNLTIDMSAHGRPPAKGSIIDSQTIRVTFPDDATFTATLIAPRTIRWSNGTAWTKVASAAANAAGAPISASV